MSEGLSGDRTKSFKQVYRVGTAHSTLAANRNLNRVQVVPITSSVSRIYPSEAMVTLQGLQGKAMADQLTMVSKQRMRKKAGEITSEEMTAVELAIRVQLGLR